MVVESRLLKNMGKVKDYFTSPDLMPLFLEADTYKLLQLFPDDCIDCIITSPPYWGHRAYANGGIGLEENWEDYITKLLLIFVEVKRILKPSGSFWLNIGDTYQNKSLIGIPWRIALQMTDQQGWIIRNSVVWNKVKGAPDNAKDKLRNVYEPFFHFVKTARYFYDVDAIRTKPRQSKVVNGSVVSATGVSGVRYRRQIELSTALNDSERINALKALDEVLEEVRAGKTSDFRMIIRGQQRTTHSDSEKVSGRARELAEKGFYFLKYHPNGSKPSDVWDILPEDTQRRKSHFAPYPEDLCKIPILATCPKSGIVLDPFMGTGTTSLVAYHLQRKSIGIDISGDYINIAYERCGLTND
ncbi:DNA-methyltransferase [Leptolyngbya sp. O-77]|uniref:DNA-methyltransferase n=1 Tax=Leptolyngbya sp. O-77 TaxID=1080068 RepID=UPI00074D4604|nr:site-specific DNA-methyltransferase [Leptolyngbya sp. O-77]BAU44722.1 Modification methylase RsrI [Leptolyngbya sp. O-77]